VPFISLNKMEKFLAKIPQTWIIPNKYNGRNRSVSENDLHSHCIEEEDIAKSWSKDETEDGVIFSATLKKVRYRSSVSPSTGNDVEGLFWRTIKIRVLKAGTLVKLVEHLTPESTEVSDEDPSFLLCFLCTYKAFTSTEQILDLLLER